MIVIIHSRLYTPWKKIFNNLSNPNTLHHNDISTFTFDAKAKLLNDFFSQHFNLSSTSHYLKSIPPTWVVLSWINFFPSDCSCYGFIMESGFYLCSPFMATDSSFLSVMFLWFDQSIWFKFSLSLCWTPVLLNWFHSYITYIIILYYSYITYATILKKL